MIARLSSSPVSVCAAPSWLLSPALAQDLTGAGATFPQPLYAKWFNDYAAKTGVKINYQSIGSGGGIRQFTDGTVDFGATDAPMSDEEIAKLKGARATTSRLCSAPSSSRTTLPEAHASR